MTRYGIVMVGSNRNILAGKGMSRSLANKVADEMRKVNFLHVVKVMPENKAEALCQPKLV